MKFLFFYIAVLLSLFLVSSATIHDRHKKNIRKVQRHFTLQSRLRQPGASWEAGENGLTDNDPKDLRALCGTNIPSPIDVRRSYRPPPLLLDFTQSTTIPDQFDASIKWPSCTTIKQVRSQGFRCGSCWAFAGAGVISDRYCIASGGKKTKVLSPQDMLACNRYGRPENICSGAGDLSTPYVMLVQNGIVSGGDYMSRDGCMPYTLYYGSAPWNNQCTGICTNPDSGLQYARDKTYGSMWYEMGNNYNNPWDPSASLDHQTVIRQIQRELMARGPLTVGILVYDDFFTYRSGVYQYVTGNFVYGHAMKLIGWGTENGTDYWLIVNSWGREWGMNGLLKFVRGTNHLGIENNLVTGLVDPSLKRPLNIWDPG